MKAVKRIRFNMQQSIKMHKQAPGKEKRNAHRRLEMRATYGRQSKRRLREMHVQRYSW